MTPRRITQAAALVAFASIALAGCSVAGQPKKLTTPASLSIPSYTPSATVGKLKISQSEVVARARILALLTPSVTPAEALTNTTTQAALNQLVEESLILQGNPVHPSAADSQEMSQNLGEYLVQAYGSPTAVAAREKALKLTSGEVTAFATEEASFSLAAQKFETATVTTDQVKAYYEANKGAFALSVPEVNARHILVKTQSLAQEILAKLQNGANFAALAKEYSIDTGTKDQGGNLGWFTASEMVAPFSKAAFSTPVGHYVIAHSQYGWHVIQVLGKEAAGTVPPLSQIASQVQQAAQQAEDQTNVGQAASQLKKRFPVVMHSPSGK